METDVSCRQMTGLSVKEMEWVYAECKDGLLSLRAHMHATHTNIPPTSPHNMLCIAIHWMRRHPTYRSMQVTLDRTVDYWERLIRRVVSIIDEKIVHLLIYPADDSSPESNLSTLSAVKLAVDTTFIPLPRTPYNPKLFHPKSPTKAAWKFQVTCDFTHRIVDVGDAEVGSMHDITVLLRSGVLEQQTEDTRIIGDKGYRGDFGVVTPANRPKTRNQEKAKLEDERTQRHELETQRACIEQVNKRLKDWAIIRQTWRGTYPDTTHIDPIIRSVCALTQLTFDDQPLYKGSRTHTLPSV